MTTLSPPIRIGPEGLPPDDKTLGWHILDWTDKYLLQPDGDRAGDKWRFTDEQVRFVLWWYALDDKGRFAHRYGMLRRMKGWGKDPVGAALCCIEFVGPCRFSGRYTRAGYPIAVPHSAAWVQTAAVSRDQTRNTMTLLPGMLSPRAIEEYKIDLGKEIIYAHKGRARLEAVTSSPRALEGQRSTFVLKNETHLWLHNNEGHEMAEVISRNLAKSRDGSARALAISNAHNPGEDSDAERDWLAYVEMQEGKTRGRGMLYDSVEAPPDTELADPDSLRAGILAARGDSEWLDVDRLMEEIYDPRTRPSMARRFYLNQIHAEEDAWVTPQEWDACADKDKVIQPGEICTLGLDVSEADDHTALVLCRVSDSHLVPLGIWNPADYDRLSFRRIVKASVRVAINVFDIVGFYSDVHPWESDIEDLEQEYGSDMCAKATSTHPIAWDMRNRKQETVKMIESLYDGIVNRDLTHTGDLKASQYVYNAKRYPTIYGISVSKETPMSSRKIDYVPAAALSRKARQDYLALPEDKRRRKAGISVFISGDDSEEDADSFPLGT